MRFKVAPAVMVLAWFLIAAVAAAQENQENEVTFQLTRDGVPVAGADISMMVNGIKTSAGQTNAQGEAKVPMDLLNVIKGTTVEVNVIRTPDTAQIVVAPPGQPTDDCDDAEADPDDEEECDRLVGLIWTGGSTVKIDVTSTGSSMRVEEPSAAGVAPGTVTVAAGTDLVWYSGLEDAACAGSNITVCDVDDMGGAISLAVDLQVTNLISVSGGWSFGSSSWNQNLLISSSDVLRNTDLDVNIFTVQTRVMVPVANRTRIGGGAGIAYCDESTQSTDMGPTGETNTFERSDNVTMGTVGAVAEVDVTSNLGVRGTVDVLRTFGDNDGGNQHRAGIAAFWRVN